MFKKFVTVFVAASVVGAAAYAAPVRAITRPGEAPVQPGKPGSEAVIKKPGAKGGSETLSGTRGQSERAMKQVGVEQTNRSGVKGATGAGVVELGTVNNAQTKGVNNSAAQKAAVQAGQVEGTANWGSVDKTVQMDAKTLAKIQKALGKPAADAIIEAKSDGDFQLLKGLGDVLVSRNIKKAIAGKGITDLAEVRRVSGDATVGNGLVKCAKEFKDPVAIEFALGTVGAARLAKGDGERMVDLVSKFRTDNKLSEQGKEVEEGCYTGQVCIGLGQSFSNACARRGFAFAN